MEPRGDTKRVLRRFAGLFAAGAVFATIGTIPGGGVAGASLSVPATDGQVAAVLDGGQQAPSFGVGRRELTLVDPTRPTDADPNRGLPARPDRTIPTLVLYPTDSDPADPTQVDAPAAHGQFPLVVFSHGFTANGAIYAPLLEPLVRHGYVVALPTFPLSSGPGSVAGDYVNQPGDVSFVIDEMFELTTEPQGWLTGRVNKRRVAAAGHSLGALTTIGVVYNSCCIDPRIKAAIPISGGPLPYPGGEYTWPDTPQLLIHGAADDIVPVAASDFLFDAATGRTWYLRLNEADHVNLFFGEDGELTQRAMLLFLDAKLKGRWRPLERFAQEVADSGRAEWRTKNL